VELISTNSENTLVPNKTLEVIFRMNFVTGAEENEYDNEIPTLFLHQ
jgi:hypothetical protein